MLLRMVTCTLRIATGMPRLRILSLTAPSAVAGKIRPDTGAEAASDGWLSDNS